MRCRRRSKPGQKFGPTAPSARLGRIRSSSRQTRARNSYASSRNSRGSSGITSCSSCCRREVQHFIAHEILISARLNGFESLLKELFVYWLAHGRQPLLLSNLPTERLTCSSCNCRSSSWLPKGRTNAESPRSSISANGKEPCAADHEQARRGQSHRGGGEAPAGRRAGSAYQLIDLDDGHQHGENDAEHHHAHSEDQQRIE